jgi:NADPH:quinone reductase-like Zn-dependent oxidoreductase
MKAAVRHRYGPPEVIQIEEIERPTPAADEVLIRVHAVSLNASDWEFLTGSPAYVRMWGPLSPRHAVLGSDIAGTVEAVGAKVTRFRPGDEVFGDILGQFGGLAELVCARERCLLAKPASVTMEQAAAVPQAGLVALQGLRDKGQLKSGERVLITGAGGGAGSFAVQLAKAWGAHVTGVDTGHKLDFIRSLGAEHAIDYTRDDYAGSGARYDLVLDLAAHRSIFDNQRVLAPGGRYVAVGGSVPRLLEILFVGPVLSLRGKRMGIMAAEANKDLAHMMDLIDARTVAPIIDKCFSLGDVREALRHLGTGQARGKVVITIPTNDRAS